jgi:hypothetical protein
MRILESKGEFQLMRTILFSCLINFSIFFQAFADGIPYGKVTCEGAYPRHLQGICIDGYSIFWSFTTVLVKTDFQGKLIQQIPVADHHGDLCYHAGRLYVAVNLGKFNHPDGNADSWIYVYDASTLEELEKHEVQQVFHGAGGIGVKDENFFVVGGLPAGIEENYVYEYDSDFRFIQKHTLPSGYTRLGIQTATFAHDRWWFGCYGSPKILLIADEDLNLLGRYEFDCSLGIEGYTDGRLLAADGNRSTEKTYTGWLQIAVPDEIAGLRILERAH